MSRAAKIIVLLLVSVSICGVLSRPQEAIDESEAEDKNDLEASEFFFWPKFFFVKPAPIVTYDYQPVNYTYYKPVWTPYTVTVQKPVAVAVAAADPAPAVVATKAVSVNVGELKLVINKPDSELLFKNSSDITVEVSEKEFFF
ncbi:hypothetical protein DMENIID0001_117470 [Sergentomyia squamirostris]